jgi:hypothetical protein
VIGLFIKKHMPRKLDFELLVPLDTSVYNFCSNRERGLTKTAFIPVKSEHKVRGFTRTAHITDNRFCRKRIVQALVCKME